MARDLGTKYTCFECGTKFYDLKKPAPICPKCGADQRAVPPPAPTSRRASRAPAAAEEVAEEPDLDSEEDEDEDTEDEDDE